MNKLTAEQRVQRAHVWLMGRPEYCLYSGIIMLGKTEVVDDVPTACTDGRNTQYGRKFVGGLNDKELRALILHENLHKAFQHLTTWKELWKENAQLANMACDYVINLMIHDSDPEHINVQLPECGLLDEKYRGLDANTVYKMLKQNPPKGSGEGSGEGESGGGLDSHDWEGAEGMSHEEKESLARDVDQALRQGKILAGKMGGNVPKEVADALTPTVDWRAVLREFITSMCQDKDTSTWRRPSRRWVAQDVYMPSLIGESVGRVVIGADLSGSMWDQLPRLLGEIKSICDTVRPEGIDLLYWDTSVCQHEKYDRDQLDGMLTSTRPRGGGGTSPQCVINYIKAHEIKAECCVMLTDGYVDNWGGNWPCPVLWGITSDVVAGNGKTVRINN